jgi:hypothetical protein
MLHRLHHRYVYLLTLVMLLVGAAIVPITVSADRSAQNPQAGSLGLEGTVAGPPPSTAATIISPANTQTFTTTPITVSGLCTTGLLVKIFSNNIFVGSETCVKGSYSLQVDLFNGENDLITRVYDALDQQGPDSNVTVVHFIDAQFAQFATHVSLSSIYARRGATPGTELQWPIILSGGNGPYAISVDWGDGKATDLLSQSFPGTFTIEHIYDAAGVYNVVIKATDANNTNAYLQLVGVGNGVGTSPGTTTGTGSTTSNSGTTGTPKSITLTWFLLLPIIPLAGLTFWLGSRYELSSIRRNLEKNRDELSR